MSATAGVTLTHLIDMLVVGPWAIPTPIRSDTSGVEPGVGSEIQLTGATHDSRMVVPGMLFCCIVGTRRDGHHFAQQAVDNGATALLVEHEVTTRPAVPQIIVVNSREAMGPAASIIHGRPSGQLIMIGITGTNGKTSTAHLLGAVLEEAGLRVEVLGTLTQSRTTPEATDLQAQLAGFVAAGVTHVVMEVTSHALVLNRVDGIHFRVVVFTNLSQDHLDFHETMESYFRAKALLFTTKRADEAVVNADDPHGRLLLNAAQIPTTSFQLSLAADVHVAVRSSFRWHDVNVVLRLGGAFSVSNALAAATVADRLGIAAEVVATGLGRAEVPGRFEPVDAGQSFTVLVDYAHTPDALQRVLEAARAITPQGRRLTVVFGCGGDRDMGKRPKMGAIATDLADLAILTSDNPRTESPMAIIDQVVSGVTRTDVLVVEPDRRIAIERALRQAHGGDVVVLAGKGHESGQEIKGQVLPFDDRLVARAIIESILGSSRSAPQ